MPTQPSAHMLRHPCLCCCTFKPSCGCAPHLPPFARRDHHLPESSRVESSGRRVSCSANDRCDYRIAAPFPTSSRPPAARLAYGRVCDQSAGAPHSLPGASLADRLLVRHPPQTLHTATGASRAPHAIAERCPRAIDCLAIAPCQHPRDFCPGRSAQRLLPTGSWNGSWWALFRKEHWRFRRWKSTGGSLVIGLLE